MKKYTLLLLFTLTSFFTFSQTTHYVNAGMMYFAPADLTINQGDVVVWINDGGNHDVNGLTNSITGEPFNNPESFSSDFNGIEGEEIYSHTFYIDGFYNYDCSMYGHASMGMVGTINVNPVENNDCDGTWIEVTSTGLCSEFLNEASCTEYGCSWTNEYVGIFVWEDVCGWGNQTYEIDESYCDETIIMGCSLSGGENVANGWTGYDTGDNWCNSCLCENGILSCTEIFCEDTSGCLSDIDEDGICEDDCEEIITIIEDCECSFFNPNTYTVSYNSVDEASCTQIETCYCECINDVNENGICDEDEEGCWENGEFYDIYSQLFVDECTYYECVVSSGFFWSDLMTIDGCNENDCPCINPEWIEPFGVCITLWDPVIGCDGIQYSNDCVAAIAGVTSWTYENNQGTGSQGDENWCASELCDSIDCLEGYECINGECVEIIEGDIEGCTDETACNYMNSAIIDNGSCIYQGDSGCDDCGTMLDFTNYGDGEYFSQTYNAPPGLIITINFNGSTESCCDHIYVNGVEYDGILDGIVIGDEVLDIEWTTDGSVNSNSGYGWSAELICEEANPGCTQPYADNYNPNANTDDGTCELDCDYLITYQSYVDLNYDNSISNYYCNYYVSDGTYTIQEAISYGYNCDCIQAGCTDSSACNYDPTMTIDDGNCEYGCYMEDCNTYPSEYFDCAGNCLSNYFINNCNYYICDNGIIGTDLIVIDGCQEGDILGCTEETACNFIPNATFDDGTCVFDGDSECEDCGTLLDFNNYTDNELFSETYYAPPGLIITINFSGSTESCCDHVYVNGVEYDGILDGIVIGDEVLNIDWTSDGSVNSNSGYGWSAELICEEAISGCTQPYAENYNPDANTDDGSCELGCNYLLTYQSYIDLNYDNSVSNYNCNYYVTNGIYTVEQAESQGFNCDCVLVGCTDETANNYDETANIDDCSCIYDNNCTPISFNNNDSSLGWQITNLNGEVVLENNYNGTGQNPVTPYCGNFCFEDGCYIINMSSYYGQGWSPNTTLNIGNQTYTLNSGYEGIMAFDYNSPNSCEIGCTDSEASNYNENAILDDGSCVVFGCTITAACNYNADATAFDGSCYYCYDDNCILYPTELFDCDGNCFDQDNDGICDAEEVEGCADSTACNYNPEATEEGSCEYPEQYYDCNGLCNNDADNDSICNEIDNCPQVYNPNQQDNNNDGIGDDCDGVTIDEESKFEWNIYPNPLRDYTIIHFTNQTGQEYSIELIDISGNIIFNTVTTNSSYRIENRYSAGYYIIQLKSNQKVDRKTLIIE